MGKRFLALLLAAILSAGLAIPAAALEFSDVPPGHWARDAIAGCEGRKIVSGYGDGTFHPDSPVTNVQFVVMLTRAFYADAVAEYAAKDWAKYEAWWWPNWRVMLDAKLAVLTDLIGVQNFEEKANQPINRLDMAQLLWNVLKEKGFSVSESERQAVKKNISDWMKIPVIYREGVASVYALGVIGGLSDGSFGGEAQMNRAQGCTVIERARKLIEAGPSRVNTPTETEKPETTQNNETSATTTPPTTKQEHETSQKPPETQTGNTKQDTPSTQTPVIPQIPTTTQKPETSVPEQTPAAPQKPSEGQVPPPVVNRVPEAPPDTPEETAPTLSNGKEITEENVLSMLAELKEAYPDGMFWDGGTAREGTPSKALNDTIKRSYSHYLGGMCSMTRGCGGFASLVSDSIFGSGSANPARKLENLSDIRPGDVLVKLNAYGRLTHIAIAAGRPVGTMEFYGVKALRVPARGGSGNDMVYSIVNTVPASVANGMYYEAWTRYPAE